MPETEIKQEGQVQPTPAGDGSANPSAPNQGSSDDSQNKIKELEEKLKAKDAEIQDARNTRATIELRQRQVAESNINKSTDPDIKKRISAINERRQYDPDGADTEMASLITETATRQAHQVITQQTAVERLKSSVKTASPDFDDEMVDFVMDRANSLVVNNPGKYLRAEDAVKDATDFLKTKLDGYAKKKNAVPPLPAGALAENGGSNTPPKAPPPQKEPTALEELEAFNSAKRKRII